MKLIPDIPKKRIGLLMKIKQVVVAMSLLVGMQAFGVGACRRVVFWRNTSSCRASQLVVPSTRETSGPKPCRSETDGLGPWSLEVLMQERLQLNEDTLWAGGPYDPVNPTAKAALPEVRQLIFDGKYSDAARSDQPAGDGATIAATSLSNRWVTCCFGSPTTRPWKTIGAS